MSRKGGNMFHMFPLHLTVDLQDVKMFQELEVEVSLV